MKLKKKSYWHLQLLFFAACLSFLHAQTTNYAASRTPGELAVSPTGAATYLVPLALPPGIKEVVPSLALNYNSQGGDGIAGWGWNVAGLSTITRVGATRFHDGVIDPVDFDELDRYALDGQRLLIKSGEYHKRDSEYQTETYSNLKIVAQGNSGGFLEYFMVYHPDGSRSWYGSEGAKNDLEWAISAWEDPQGNRIDYSYEQDGKLLRIKTIRYGSQNESSHPNLVEFRYEDKGSYYLQFIGGESFSRKQILTSISVKTHEELYRKYELEHLYNDDPKTRNTHTYRVASIQESTKETQKKPIVFNYENPAKDIKTTANSFQPFANTDTPAFHPKFHSALSGDFDGDGVLDYLKYHKDVPDFTYYFTGKAQSYRFYDQNADFIASGESIKGVLPTTWQTTENHIATAQAITSITEDLVEQDPAANCKIEGFQSTLTFRTYRFKPSGTLEYYEKIWENNLIYDANQCDDDYFPAEQKEDSCTNNSIREISKRFVSGDFNGDGITDAFLIQNPYTYSKCYGGSGNTVSVYEYENKSPTVYWVNLDRTVTNNFVSHAGSLLHQVDAMDRFMAGDYDGDGVVDLWHFRSQGGLFVYSFANGRLEAIAKSSFPGNAVYFDTLMGDFNGDGKADVMIPTNIPNISSDTIRINGPNTKKAIIEKTQRPLEDNDVWEVFYAHGDTERIHQGRGASGFITQKITGIPYTTYSSLYVNPQDYTESIFEESHYIAYDADGDGKTDIIRHNKQAVFDRYQEKETNLREKVWLYKNIPRPQRSREVEVTDITYRYFATDIDHKVDAGVPIRLNYNQHTLEHQYSYLIGNQIHQKSFTANHGVLTRIAEVSHAGLTQKIAYSPLSVVGDTPYVGEYSQTYPYVNANSAPNFYLADQVLTLDSDGKAVSQQFRYHGAVSHVGGLGFLGFKGLARTNSYGAGTVALWNHSLHDPKKRGALTHSWTSRSFNENFSIPTAPFDGQGYSYLQKAEYQYQTVTTEQGVFVNNVDNILSNDGLTGFETLQTYNYDHYYNPTSILTERQGGSTRQSFVYSNNPTATNKKYHVGRVAQETTTETWNNNTHTTTAQYSYDNNLVEQTKTQGDGTQWLTEDFDYDAFGNLEKKTLSAPDPELADRTQSYTYTTDGRFLESSTDIEGLTMTFAYNADGTLEKETDPFNKTTTYTYDGWQRPETVTDYLGNTATIEYVWSGDHIVKHNTGADGSQSKEYIDVWNRITHKGSLTLDGQWRWISTTHTADGKIEIQSEPFLTERSDLLSQPLDAAKRAFHFKTQNRYDAVGRLIAQNLASGKRVQTTYAQNNPTTTVNDGYQEITTVLDSRGKIAKVTDPGGTVYYTYHPTGELEQSDYQGHVVSVGYDGWGRKTSLFDPSAGIYEYQYDLYGQLLKETAPLGTTDYDYDAFGKLEKKTQKGDETHLITNYQYDARTKLLKKETTNDRLLGDTQTYTYDYDAYQRPETITETNNYVSFSQTLSYDTLGRLYSENRTVAGGGTRQNVNLTHGYAANGQLNTLKDGSRTLWTLQQDNARGQATQIQLGNGISKSRSYDPVGYLERITDGNALTLAYTYNKRQGTMTSRHHGGYDKEFFDHDNRSRLTRVVSGGKQTFKQDYDALGRIAQNSKVGRYHYLPLDKTPNRYLSEDFSLNAAGYKHFREYWKRAPVFNMDRKVSRVTQEDIGGAEFAYNARMQRVHAWYYTEKIIEPRIRKTKTSEAVPAVTEIDSRHRKHYATIFPAEITITEAVTASKPVPSPAASKAKPSFTARSAATTQSQNTVITQYLGGDAYTAPVIKQNSQYRYLHRDHLGSILAITDDSGNLLEQRHFDPWGTITSFKKDGQEAKFRDTILNRGFTGHEHFEQVRLIHMNGRMYDSRLHHFLGPDNFIQDPYNTLSYDRQAYVWNNPLMNSDPSGEFIQVAYAIFQMASLYIAYQNIQTAIDNGASFADIVGQLLVSQGMSILSGGISDIAGDALFSAGAKTFGGKLARFAVGTVLPGFLSGVGGAVASGTGLKDAFSSGLQGAAFAMGITALEEVGAAIAAKSGPKGEVEVGEGYFVNLETREKMDDVSRLFEYRVPRPRKIGLDGWELAGATADAVLIAVDLVVGGPTGEAAPMIAGRKALWGALKGGAGRSTALVKTGTQFSKHSIHRMAQRRVTPKMAQTAISKGQKFYDPLNKSINYILPNGFGSGKSLLVGTNPLTGEITTVLRSSKNLIKSRMTPIK